MTRRSRWYEFWKWRWCEDVGDWNCEYSASDYWKIIPCIIWSLFSLSYSVVHAILHLEHGLYPSIMPIFWGILCSMPAFTCATLIALYHRDSVRQKGLSKDSAYTLNCLFSYIIINGMFVFAALTFAFVATNFVCDEKTSMEQRANCSHGNFATNAFWFILTAGWFLIQTCLTPRQKTIDELVVKYNRLNPPRALRSHNSYLNSFPEGHQYNGQGVFTAEARDFVYHDAFHYLNSGSNTSNGQNTANNNNNNNNVNNKNSENNEHNTDDENSADHNDTPPTVFTLDTDIPAITVYGHSVSQK